LYFFLFGLSTQDCIVDFDTEKKVPAGLEERYTSEAAL
jgi:hypothetical protein